jgi:hypothetical protein
MTTTSRKLKSTAGKAKAAVTNPLIRRRFLPPRKGPALQSPGQRL